MWQRVGEDEAPELDADTRFCGYPLDSLHDITSEEPETINGQAVVKYQAGWELDGDPTQVSPFDQVKTFWVDESGLLLREEDRYLHEKRDGITRTDYHGFGEPNIVEAPVN